MKRIIAVIVVFIILFSLSACSRQEYSDIEKFAARAGYTIMRQMGDAQSFVYEELEYSEDEGTRLITTKCSFFYGNNDYKRYVFFIGIGGSFFDKYEGKSGCIIDGETGLYLVNMGDYNYEFNPEKAVDKAKATEIANKYKTTKDKELLGME